jgi:hypothetical protein
MKLKDARDAYEVQSGKASDVMRQLCFAGIGLIWVFKTTSSTFGALDRRLLRAGLFIVLALFLDLAQYLAGTITWFLYFRYKESLGIASDTDFLAPPSLNWPAWTLFHLKTLFTLIAYVIFIIPFLFSKFVS